MGPAWRGAVPNRSSPRRDWLEYGKYIADTAITFHPIARQLKTVVPAYHAADALWKYCRVYKEGGALAVAQTAVKDRAVQGLSDLQTEATWNLIGADKFVPAPYKEPVRELLGTVMTKISEKEVDFVEGYLARKTVS
jgi:hypothetical protein